MRAHVTLGRMKYRFGLCFAFLAALLSCAHPQKSAVETHTAEVHTVKLFAAPLDWTSFSGAAERSIAARLEEIVSAQSSFDPDCYYYGADPCANPTTEWTMAISKLSDAVKSETLGTFEVRTLKNGKERRDFGGIAQGFVLNELRKAYARDWSADFSGDIFLAPGSQPRVIGVADARIPELDVARIEMSSGWVMGGTSPEYGDEFREAKSGRRIRKSEFKRLVLVARPEFDGGRLDAWETALMVGGLRLLDHLWSLKPYVGSWGYFYILANGRRVCSQNLTCDLRDVVQPSKIKVVW
jgi:hypothetical protein